MNLLYLTFGILYAINGSKCSFALRIHEQIPVKAGTHQLHVKTNPDGGMEIKEMKEKLIKMG